MTFNDQLRQLSEYRNAYLLALSAAMGSIFYGWDMCVSFPLYLPSYGMLMKFIEVSSEVFLPWARSTNTSG